MSSFCFQKYTVLSNRLVRDTYPRTSPNKYRASHRTLAPLLAKASASGGDSEAYPTNNISVAEAYNILGLKNSATYDDVLNAKNKLVQKFKGQTEKQMQVELAYDIIFSSNLKARLTGDMPVSNKVRFADVNPPRRSSSSKPEPISLPGGVLAIRKLPNQAAITSSALFGALMTWSLLQGLLEPSPAAAVADVPGIQLALGTASAAYFLRDNKKASLPKAIGLAMGGLVLGTMVGAAIESWVRVDIVPLGSLSSPGVFVGEFSLIGLWAAVFFLA